MLLMKAMATFPIVIVDVCRCICLADVRRCRRRSGFVIRKIVKFSRSGTDYSLWISPNMPRADQTRDECLICLEEKTVVSKQWISLASCLKL